MKRIISVIMIIGIFLSCFSFGFSASAAADEKLFEEICVNAWKNREKSADVTACGVEPSDIKALFNKTWFSNLGYYYVNTKYTYYTNGKVVTGITFDYTSYPESRDAIFSEETEKIENMLLALPTDIDKIIFLHEYLTENTQYDYTYSKRDISNCLLDKTCVCDGYARAFMMLMNKAGVNCKYISSDENNHAWNMVKIGSEWYYVDTTWDDTADTNKNLIISRKKCIANGHKSSNNDWKINLDTSASSFCTSTKYDEAFFSKAKFAMSYGDGLWYYSDGSTISCGDALTLSSKSLKTVSDKWHLWNDSSRFYTGGYSDAVLFNNRIYYNTPSSILSMKTDGSDVREEYSLSSEELSKGYIYNLTPAESGIIYHLAKGPLADYEETYKSTLKIGNHVHSYSEIVTAPTCQSEGYTTYTCLCGSSYKDNYTAKTNHSKVSDAAVKATLSADGKTAGSHCRVCSAVITKQKKVYKVSNISLSKSSFTYNAKIQKPSVTVKDSTGKALISGTDYTLTYSNSASKSTGKYSVKVTLKGSYKGSKTLYYTIAPKAVTSLKVASPSKKTAKISFEKATGASGYEIYYRLSGSSSYKKLTTTTKNTFAYSKLKSSKTYYFKVRAFKTVDGSRIYGSFTKAKSIKIK